MRTIELVLLLVCGQFGQAMASDSKADRDTLRGIKTIQVVVLDISADAIKDGLTVQQIRTDVELRLRKAGVVVVDDLPKSNRHLTIMAACVKRAYEGTSVYAYDVTVSFDQPAITVSNNVLAVLSTWSVGSVGLAGSSNMSRFVRETIGNFVDEYINAYLSVNPK